MTLHLKDRVIEQKLNELSNGEFSKILNETDMKNPNCICFTIDKKEDIELSVFIRPEAIEIEYNPNGWNEFPAVTPPDSRVCQLTVSHSLDEPIKYFAAFYDFRAKTWRVQDSGRQIDTKVLKDGFVTFRAWRD